MDAIIAYRLRNFRLGTLYFLSILVVPVVASQFQTDCSYCLRNETLAVTKLNCSDILPNCEICNSSLDCDFGVCTEIYDYSISDEKNFYGICQKRKSVTGTSLQPDPVGKIISIALLSIFLAIVLVICLR